MSGHKKSFYKVTGIVQSNGWKTSDEPKNNSKDISHWIYYQTGYVNSHLKNKDGDINNWRSQIAGYVNSYLRNKDEDTFNNLDKMNILTTNEKLEILRNNELLFLNY